MLRLLQLRRQTQHIRPPGVCKPFWPPLTASLVLGGTARSSTSASGDKSVLAAHRSGVSQQKPRCNTSSNTCQGRTVDLPAQHDKSSSFELRCTFHTAARCSAGAYRAAATHSQAVSRLDSSATVQRAPVRDTIVALSSGAGRSGVAVIRVSGPAADAALSALLPPARHLPEARFAALASLKHPETGAQLDRALVLRFPAPASFTGEDVVELHVHGGPAVVRAVLGALAGLPALRLAEPGEFTRRAFQAGKLDMTEVEGTADLLAAETEAQRVQALRQNTGVQRKRFEAWRTTLLRCLAHIEAVIDFGEDEEIGADVAAEVLPRAVALRQELQRHLQAGRRGELVRSGVRVAIMGPPNAGKSTLLNHLARRDAAIVSPIPGTTRDTVEVNLELAGYKVIVTDTAGLRQTEDDIEQQGIRRAHAAAEAADILVIVHDVHEIMWANLMWASAAQHGTAAAGGMSHSAAGSSASPHGVNWRFTVLDLPVQHTAARPVLVVLNKTDLVPVEQQAALFSKLGDGVLDPLRCSSEVHPDSSQLPERCNPGMCGAAMDRDGMARCLFASCTSKEGMDAVEAALQQTVVQLMQAGTASHQPALITRLRHRQHIEACIAALQRYEEASQQLEVAAGELRNAAGSLGRLTGAIDTESVLDAVFSEFCVGK